MNPPVRRALNVVMLGLVLWANALAGSGALSGDSIGAIANRYESSFLPSSYVFGIWSLIYAALAAFAVFQALPRQRDNAAIHRLGNWWLLNGVLNIAWIVAFSFSLFGLAMVIMVALLANLVVIHERIGIGRRELDRPTRAFVAFPFSIYLAWILVAVIANGFQYATYLGWTWLGTGALPSAVMMVVATAVAAAVVVRRGNRVFAFVSAWAFVGIADRHADVTLIVVTAYVCAVAGLVAVLVSLSRRRRATA